MKPYLTAAALSTGLWLGLAAPAGAIIVIDGTVAGDSPDIRLTVEGEFQPCIVEGGISASLLAGVSRAVGDMNPCVAEGGMEPCIAEGGIQPCIVEVDVRTDARRS